MGGYHLELPAGVMGDNKSPEAAAPWAVKGETSYQGDIAEYSPAVCVARGLSNCTAHIVTVTIHGDEAENVRPKPMPGEGEFVKVISFPKNHRLQRLDALVAEEQVTGGARVHPVLCC